MTIDHEFLGILFPDLNNGFIEVRAIHPFKKPVSKFYPSIEALTADSSVIGNFSQDYNVYIGVCPRQKENGDKGAIKFIWVLWIDMDAKNFSGGKDEIFRRLNSFPIHPTIIVDSGNGFHAYWRLKEPVEIRGDRDVSNVEAYLKALAANLDGDFTSAEIARILRLPGTLNHKDPNFLKSVAVIQLNRDKQYNLGDFDLVLNVLSHQKDQKGNPPGWIAESLSNMQPGNRNATFAQIIGRLHRDGLTQNDIFAVLSPLASQHSFPLEELRNEVDGICKRYPNQAPITGQELNSLNSLASQLHSKKWPDPPRSEAYYGLVGEIVRTIEPHTESDPVAILIQSLIAFGSIIGRSAYFAVEADRHYLNMFAVLVGVTAKGRKGTSWGIVKYIFEGIENEWSFERVQSGLSSGEGLIWAVRDRIEKTESRKDRGKVVGEQKVLVDAGITDKRLLDLESEFASTLRVIGRDGNTLSALIRQAWDTGTLRVLTKNSPAKSTDAHISIIAHITKDELLRYLDKTETANGFANRFMWVCVKRNQVLPDGGNIKSVDFGLIMQKLRTAVNFAKQVTEIKRDESAKDLWHKEYERLSSEKPALQGALTARAEAQVMRLACIYALFDCSEVVCIEHLQAALALWDYSEESVAYVFGDNLGDPVADAILAALRAKREGMSRTEISNLFHRHIGSNQISRALNVLKELGMVEMFTTTTLGRSIETWIAVAK